MSLAERRRNNVRAGIFVTLGIALALVVTMMLTDVLGAFAGTNEYVITFDVDDGISTLSEGSVVRVGGVEMGSVVGIAPQIEQDRFETIHVRVEVRDDVPLFTNARIYLSSALLGSEAWLDISHVGSGQVATEDTPIPAMTASSLAGIIGADYDQSIGRILNNIEGTTAFTAQLESIYNERLSPIIGDVAGTVSDTRALAGRIRGEDWPRWAGRVDQTLASVNDAADQLDELMNDGRTLIAETQAGVSDVRQIVADEREGVGTIVDNLTDATGNVNAISAEVREQTLKQVARLLDRGQEGIDAFSGTMQLVQDRLGPELPTVQAAVRNASLASQQLKLATLEVRRSPWKLLYRPSDQELEHELLYEAARSFSLAAADLKFASQAMDHLVTQHGDRLNEDRETFEDLQQTLQASYKRYEDAQNRLLDVILEDAQ